jgi:CRP/FNR family transcriptional regulator, cyclic AMP receptor protein
MYWLLRGGNMVKNELLKQLYLFKDLSNSELSKITDIAEIGKYSPGDEIFSQGDRATSLYILQYGSVKIHMTEEGGESVEITRLGPGSHFGEMPFLDGEARSANATALEPSEIVVVDYDKLSEIMISHQGIAVHFYRQFALFLCGRLRLTTKDLTFARSQVVTHF